MSIQRSKIKWIGDLPVDNFTVIPNALIRDESLSAGSRMVAVHLWSLGNGWNVSIKSIARALGLWNKTVGTALRTLIERGWLRRVETVGRNGGANWYGYIGHRAHRIGQPSVSNNSAPTSDDTACKELPWDHSRGPTGGSGSTFSRRAKARPKDECAECGLSGYGHWPGCSAAPPF